jgi:hypothetical protein
VSLHGCKLRSRQALRQQQPLAAAAAAAAAAADSICLLGPAPRRRLPLPRAAPGHAALRCDRAPPPMPLAPRPRLPLRAPCALIQPLARAPARSEPSHPPPPPVTPPPNRWSSPSGQSATAAARIPASAAASGPRCLTSRRRGARPSCAPPLPPPFAPPWRAPSPLHAPFRSAANHGREASTEGKAHCLEVLLLYIVGPWPPPARQTHRRARMPGGLRRPLLI